VDVEFYVGHPILLQSVQGGPKCPDILCASSFSLLLKSALKLLLYSGQHIYDEMGCAWNMPASYDPNVFESCAGDSGEPMGVYGGSTFHQGDPATPDAHPAPSSSSCSSTSSIGNGLVVSGSSIASGGATTVSDQFLYILKRAFRLRCGVFAWVC
jgi:hypothetical protein